MNCKIRQSSTVCHLLTPSYHGPLVLEQPATHPILLKCKCLHNILNSLQLLPTQGWPHGSLRNHLIPLPTYLCSSTSAWCFVISFSARLPVDLGVPSVPNMFGSKERSHWEFPNIPRSRSHRERASDRPSDPRIQNSHGRPPGELKSGKESSIGDDLH